MKRQVILVLLAIATITAYGAVPTLKLGQNGTVHINQALVDLNTSVNADISTAVADAYAELDTPITTNAPTSLVQATGTLTMATIPVTNDTVTIAYGATTNIYTFVATNATEVIDNEVVIGSNVTNAQANLIAVIEADGVVTMSDFDESDESTVTAVPSGTAGNSIATTASLQSTDDFSAATLTGGTDMTVTDADILISTGFLYIKISDTAWRKITLEAL